jgi:hypothetical protein
MTNRKEADEGRHGHTKDAVTRAYVLSVTIATGETRVLLRARAHRFGLLATVFLGVKNNRLPVTRQRVHHVSHATCSLHKSR